MIGGYVSSSASVHCKEMAVAELRERRGRLESDMRQLLYDFTAETKLVASVTVEFEKVEHVGHWATVGLDWRYNIEVKLEI